MTEMRDTVSNFYTQVKNACNKAGNMNIYLFFGLLCIYQVLLVFQGLDMLDEGFHVASYQQIFHNPQSVQYTFLYWFSDIAGGLVVKLLPGTGLLGIRIAGALVSVSTIVIAYQLLKKHISPGILKLSLVLLALFINNDPKDLYYNNLSSFFYLVSIYFLYTALTENKNTLLFVSGLVVGINIFTRLPNALAPSIGLVIFFYGHYQGHPMAIRFKKFFVFAAGCLAGVAAILLLMRLLGHFDLFINSIKQLSAASSGVNEKDGLNGSYGMLSIIEKPARQYFKGISLLTGIFSAIVLYHYMLRHTKEWNKLFSTGFSIIVAALLLLFCYSLIKDGILDYELIDIYTGLSLCTGIFIIVSSKRIEIRLLCLMGVFMMVIHPLGSAVGIYTVVPYSLWLTFPFAVALISDTKKFSLDFEISRQKNKLSIPVVIPERNARLIKLAGLAVMVMTCLYQIAVYPYFYDRHNRFEMTYQVDNKFMKGIYTSKARAGMISELLKESSKYIKPNDYVLAYDLMPMYHFWTETKSYIRNPCPWFYSSAVFENELHLSEADTSIALPVVVMQNINTIGFNYSKWPEVIPNENYSDSERNKGRNKVLGDFLKKHNYTIAWNNRVFTILVPGQPL